MPGGFAFGLGCTCCECPQLFCVSVRTCNIRAFLSQQVTNMSVVGATVEIRQAADPPGSGLLVASGTVDENGNLCVEMSTTGTYDVVVTHPDYWPETIPACGFNCQTGGSVWVGLRRKTFLANVLLSRCGCGDPDAVSWDLTDGTTSYSDTGMLGGLFEFDLPEDPDATVTLTGTCTSSEGHFTAKSYTSTFTAADLLCWTPWITLSPGIAAGYVCCCAPFNYSAYGSTSCQFFVLPASLYLSDEYGEIDLGFEDTSTELMTFGFCGWTAEGTTPDGKTLTYRLRVKDQSPIWWLERWVSWIDAYGRLQNIYSGLTGGAFVWTGPNAECGSFAIQVEFRHCDQYGCGPILATVTS